MKKIKPDTAGAVAGTLSMYYAVLVLLFLSLILPTFSHAQTSCGNFKEPYGGGWLIEPITDCANPFGELVDNPNLVIKFGTTFLEEWGEYSFFNMPNEIVIEGSTAFTVDGSLYLHDGNDYILKKTFDAGPRLYTFNATGTYSLVIHEEAELILTKANNVLKKMLFAITPKAIAFGGFPSKIITFTITEPTPSPQGLSNILFFPGIQASRLYSKDDGDEDKLWEPGGNGDVRRLAMTETGESIENIYAKEIIDELPVFGFNIYKGFINFLKNIDDPVGGPLITTFPYDWRQSVFDIVSDGARQADGTYIKPLSTVTNLASISPTGKVTLIAHSNGGLLAKAIMNELESSGKSDLVDKVIFIAVPHLGTPKGLATILHGYGQKRLQGFLTDDVVVRDVIKNMPGVYSLLPSQKYLESQTDPMISFENEEGGLGRYINQYGSEISNIQEYKDFLNGIEGRDDAGDRINEPIKTNPSMLSKALLEHSNILDEWTPPDGVEVFNIIGTGLLTPRSITYKEYLDVACTNNAPVLCIKQFKIESAVKLTKYGDETVVSDSADYVENDYFVDLDEVNDSENLVVDLKHANITESDTVQNLVDHILNASSTSGIEFISATEPVFNEEYDIQAMHSPARIYIRDAQGNISGRTEVGGQWREEIDGSSYFEIGGVKYVVVPSNSEYEVIIEGEGTGVYTLNVEKLSSNDEQEVIHELTASVTPSMIATYRKENGEFSNILVDEDGDGDIDVEMTLDGDTVEQVSLYEELANAILALDLSKPQENYLIWLVNKAERLRERGDGNHKYKKAEKKILKLLKRSIKWYKKKGLITKEQYKEIKTIIKKLKKEKHD